MKAYDLVVIGTGEAGKTVAKALNKAGWKTAIADRGPFGGTCSLRGCDPKKVIRGPAEARALAEQLKGKGITALPGFSWKDLIEFKETFTDDVPENTVKSLQEEGIDCYHAEVSFVDEETLQVGKEKITAKHIVLATGSEPLHLDIPGENYLIDSTQFMQLDELPDDILFVGGGYIAMEFANMAARFGSKVTIVEQEELPLSKFDPFIVEKLLEGLKSLPIDFKLKTEVLAIDQRGDSFLVKVKEDGKEKELQTKLVIHAAGRVPAVKALKLDKGGVKSEKKGVSVNEYLQSVSNPRVYACGDVAAHSLPLTPVSVREGQYVADNLKEGNSRKVEFPVVPTVAFTIPPVASVGLKEQEAHEQGLAFHVSQSDASDWFTAKRLREKSYAYKVLIEKETEHILGAHLVGPHADEMINVFTILMEAKVKTSDFKRMLFAYPTAVFDIMHML